MYKVSNLKDKGFDSLFNLMNGAMGQMQESTKKLKPLNQFDQLALRLPDGYKGRSIHSTRTKVLIELEGRRRSYNRVNKDNLDLYTFISTQSSMDVLKYLDFLIITDNRLERYTKQAIYRNNKKVVR